MTLPHTRHLDALVAKYVLRLEDVRLGWAFGSDAQPQWSSDRDYYGRDYIYRAREATETDAGYERVPDYASDGNAMLGLITHLIHRDIALVSITYTQVHPYVARFLYYTEERSTPWSGYGSGQTMPEAVCWSLLDLATIWHRAAGDQKFDVFREIAQLATDAETATVKMEVSR